MWKLPFSVKLHVLLILNETTGVKVFYICPQVSSSNDKWLDTSVISSSFVSYRTGGAAT